MGTAPFKQYLDKDATNHILQFMKARHIYYSIIASLVIVGFYHLFAVGRFTYPEFKLKVGQVSDTELIAPFDFPIIKSEERIQTEKDETIARLKKPFRIDENVMFETMAKIDELFMRIMDSANNDLADLHRKTDPLGYKLSDTALSAVLYHPKAQNLYTRLGQAFDRVYAKGVYENVSGDSILWVVDGDVKEIPKSRFNTLEQAKNDIIKSFAGTEGQAFAAEIVPQLLKANLILDEARLSIIADEATQQITVTEGMVLQNEVVVRKNVRVTDSDMIKLNSLQEAYRTKEISRSPFKILLMSVGLLLFNFIIILITNKYFIQIKKPAYQRKTDMLPISLGFVTIVLFSLLNNQIFGYSNLLIPFSMTVLAAAILIGVDFSILYSLANLLVMSPFINWETYTPVVLILTTLATILLMMRYQAFHNYLHIWFYLVISGTVINSILGIYKGDPLGTILTTTGYSIISSTISVTGLLVIVPHYEKKWHRATRQTLLELLDFEHPLLKKLATEAVGTYHHSLIVGNLSERAAEAIGANPLLARVGSYYHDIGKVINTEIFTENNEDSGELHDEISPEESAKLIKGHVLEGIELAKKYKIPQPVIDIIMQHHGTGHIRYFLEQAKQQKTFKDIDPFQYPGPKPQTKEAALVMMADIIESTTKAKNINKEEDINLIIEVTIQRLINEHQFDEAPITIKELFQAKDAMVPVLESIYRKRLDYPDPNKDDDADRDR